MIESPAHAPDLNDKDAWERIWIVMGTFVGLMAGLAITIGVVMG